MKLTGTIQLRQLLNIHYLIILSGSFFISCTHEIFSGAFQSHPVTIDARMNDWEIPLRFYDNATKLNYSITNDKNNLYICIRVVDPKAQLKITRAGMQIWIDTTGKKKKEFGITFPLNSGEKMNFRDKTNHSLANENSGSGQNESKMKRDFLASNQEMLLTGFKPTIKGFVPLHNENGINVSVNWDSINTLVYEAKIPFSTFYKKTLALSDNTKIFGIGIYVNGFEMENHPPNSGGSAGGMDEAGAGGGMSGRRMGGEHYGGGRNNYSELALTKKAWVKINLAMKNE